MQIIGKRAAWEQMEVAPESEKRQSGENMQQDGEDKAVRDLSSGRPKKQDRDSYEQSDPALLEYLEIMKQDRSSADRQRQAQSDELKALRIAHNIMRGKKVPPKDESFLLTKNFKMYMAAKNVASMKECTGTAQSELGSDGASSGAASDARSAGGSSSVSLAAAGPSSASELAAMMGAGAVESGAGELPDVAADLAAVEGLRGAGADANGLFAEAGLFSGNARTTADFSGAQGTDYSTLIEGMRAGSGVSRSLGISHTSSTQKKKRKRFYYNFKEVSAGITTAKTSGGARQVLSKARQRCAELRRELKSGRYDEEAIQMALIHAEAMERVAKKKMMHLEEEEAAKKAGGVCAGDTDDEVRREQQMQDEQLRYEMANNADPTVTGTAGMGAAAVNPDSFSGGESMEELMAEAVQTPVLDLTDGMEELMEDFNELMEDTLEEVANLNELAEDMLSGGGKTIDPDDLEEKKRKHRSEEQRAIAEADSKYLKAFFNKLQREQRAIASGASKIAAAMNGGGGMLSLASASAPAAAAKPAAGSAPADSGSVGTAVSPTEVIQAAASKVSVEAAGTADAAVSVDTAVSAVATFDVSV